MSGNRLLLLVIILCPLAGCTTVEPLASHDDLLTNADFLTSPGAQMESTLSQLSLQSKFTSAAEGEVALGDLVTPRMLVQMRLLGIEAEPSAFDALGEEGVELVLYLSYREHKQGSSGQLVSSIEPQRTSYFRIRRPKGSLQQYRAGSQLFGGPVILTEDFVTLSVEVHEVDEIDQSTRDRVRKLYDLYEGTDLSVAPEVMQTALSTPALSYIPLAFNLWELGVAAYNEINGNDVLTESPLELTLDRNTAYRPAAGSLSQIRGGEGGVVTFAEFEPDGLRRCSGMVCRGNGTVHSVVHTFTTEDFSLGTPGLRLVFGITGWPLSD